MNNYLYNLITVQFKEYFREPAILFWSFAFPIAMAWVLGIAFTSKTEITKTVAVIQNESNANSHLIKWIGGGEQQVNGKNSEKKVFEKVLSNGEGNETKFKFIYSSKDEAILALKQGKISLFIEEYEKDGITYYFDPQNSDAQFTYLLLENSILTLNLFQGIQDKNSSNNHKSNVVTLTAKGSRYIDFLVPGLIAMGIMSSCIWGIGWVLTELRIKKLMRRMIATPMKKTSFLISRIATRFILCFFEAVILYVFAYWYFRVEVDGSLLALFTVFTAGVIAFSGIAILTSSRAKSSQVANGLINAVVMPMMILSGVFFSYHNFPELVIPIIQALPLTMLADSIRSIFIEGAGIKDVALQSFYLFTVGFVTFGVGLKIYKWY
jgi:ABC-type multidrug transport system permease subunit